MERLSSALSIALSFPSDHGPTLIFGATVIGTMTVLSLLLAHSQRNQEKLIRSPAFTLLPKLSGAERAALEYPPDVLPGGRDVDTPVDNGFHFRVREEKT